MTHVASSRTGLAANPNAASGPSTTDGEPADTAAIVQRWLAEIRLAEDEQKIWIERARKTIARYLDERGIEEQGTVRFNMLWSNVQTLAPALYARAPKPQVERRHRDADPVGRAASTMLERALAFGLEDDRIDAVARLAVLDYLLTGRGQVWVRYLPSFAPAGAEATEGSPSRAPSGATEGVAWERAPIERVHWRDFLHSPARGWAEVRWVARRCYLSRAELVRRFGAEIGNAVALDWQPRGADAEGGPPSQVAEVGKKAVVWEIWDRDCREVHWVAPGHKEAPLDSRADPLRLKDFFPCPEPLLGTRGPDSLIPVPDYYEYQDQAKLLDDLINRASLLTDALRAAGIYDASIDAIRRLLSEGGGNVLIPVDQWAALAQQGGLRGAVDWLPLDQVAQALAQIYAAIERTKQLLYEVTGIADIVRGASLARETATAQQIKSRFASLRLGDRQAEVARFLRDAIRIKAEIIAEHFQAQTLALMAGATFDVAPSPAGRLSEGNRPVGPSESHPPEETLFSAAVMLLRSDVTREFRIDVETDSTIAADDDEEKRRRIEMLTTVGQFLERAIPAAREAPLLAPLLGEMLLFAARGFRTGRALEAAIEEAVQRLGVLASAPPGVGAPAASVPDQPAQNGQSGLMPPAMTTSGAVPTPPTSGVPTP